MRTAVQQAIAANDTTAVPIFESLVKLESASASASSSTATYNAQGLLNQINSATTLDDPLLQTSATSSSDSTASATYSSLLNTMYAATSSSTGGSISNSA